jgi:hypothetical protein
MQNVDANKLEFAYKYPFSQEAKEVVAELKLGSIDEQYLKEGISILKSAFKDGKIPYEKVREMSEVKYRYLLGYVYARMLVSAVGDAYSISRFAAAEADAAENHLSIDSLDNLLKICAELGLRIRKKESKDFEIGFDQFVSVPRKDSSLGLVNARISKGVVSIDEQQLRKFVGCAIEKEIASRLPIDKKELPKEIIEAAKELKPREQRISLDLRKGAYSWIEKLLSTPISDIRHRTVNLILAPYLVNVRGIDEESAAKLIIDYIEKCKRINPNTKINESYIRYQCKYAKNKGLRPMSLVRARDLLKGVAEFE